VSERYGVDMPIAREVHSVVHEGRTAAEAYRGLLRREVGSELYGMSIDPGPSQSPSPT
jgi:glycerol-3-phosphate dehydrogenase (NAD(P)+)